VPGIGWATASRTLSAFPGSGVYTSTGATAEVPPCFGATELRP
jgi:hypothetical protein